MYVPGKTQLTSSDVFLGGPATGVTDDMIGQASRVYGSDRAGTTKALNNYNNSQATTIKSAQAGAGSNIYGLQADINANPNSNVQLYTPGKTQLTAQDVFLGGQATGVSNADLNGAMRLAGNDRAGTSQALANYNQDLSSQIRAAQATNAAPRVDANLGMATLARQQMENGQAQNSVANNQARDIYNHGVSQDVFTNEYNVGNLMGNYKGNSTMAQNQNNFSNGIAVGDLMGSYGGKDTLAQKAQAIQNAQNGASLAQSASQFDRTLASNDSNAALNRIIDQQNANTNGAKVNTPTATQTKQSNQSAAYSDVDQAISANTPRDTVLNGIMGHAADYAAMGLNYSTVLAYANAKYKAYDDSVASGATSTTTAPPTSSVFKAW